MSIKDLFDKTLVKPISSKTVRDLEIEVESSRNIFETSNDKERTVPTVDFGNPESFAKYGSAEEYYQKSIERIYNEYPYDGSFAEKKKFLNESSYLDLYLLDHKYPKTNGHIIFSSNGWGTLTDSQGQYGAPDSASMEYIKIQGGPNIYGFETNATDDTLAEVFGDKQFRPHNSDNKRVDAYSNIYDTDIYKTAGVPNLGRKGSRESNLKFDLNQSGGVSIEFWLKKDLYTSDIFAQHELGDTLSDSGPKREVIFDLHNGENPGSDSYGRLTLEITGSEAVAASPFILTCRSGAYDDGAAGGFADVPLFPYLNDGEGNTGFIDVGDGGIGVANQNFVADNNWHHYAVTLQNSGGLDATGGGNFGDRGISVKFYIDGNLHHAFDTGSAICEVTGDLNANIGSLKAAISSSTGTPYANEGWGKLSGSLDEFRYWKSKRSSKDIGRHWFTHVGGGTNTDIANTELGVYYKFNEGIVGSSSYDSVVLDYSGRLSNGTWVGYPGSSARDTGSAVVESGYAAKEPKDPIIYSVHSEVKDLEEELISSGSSYDRENGAKLINYFPTFMLEEDEDGETGEGNLKLITQIISSYMDTLHSQIEFLPRIQDAYYDSSSYKPVPFMDRVLEGKGFVAPELFANSEIINQILSRDEDRNFDLKIHNIKNLIYKNVYNNLAYIYKSKGTEKSFRNLIRCFGVDDELIKINLYGNNVTHLLRDNYRTTAVSKNYADFAHPDRFNNAIVMHNPDGGIFGGGLGDQTPAGSPDSDVSSVVTGSLAYTSENDGMPITAECEVIFPKIRSVVDQGDSHFSVPFLSSSIFGWHAPVGAGPGWLSAGKDANVEVYAVRTDVNSKDAYFLFRTRYGYDAGSDDAFTTTEITSSVFKDVYDNNKWNLSVAMTWGSKMDELRPGLNSLSGSTAQLDGVTSTPIEIEFYGVNMNQDVVANEFHLTASGHGFYLTNTRVYYAGAHRENFIGDVQERSFCKVSSIRHWIQYLNTGTIQAHARDPLNYGTKNPIVKSAVFGNETNGALSASFSLPQSETLLFHWDLHSNTGSDDDGRFYIEDASSGSMSLLEEYRYGDSTADAATNSINNKVSKQYGAFYFGNEGASTETVSKEYITAARQRLPESLGSEDMVSVLDTDDEIFTRETRPVDYFFAFEKSMYQTISEEMMNMFATIVEFNNLIGNPVYKYRGEYKAMKKLRNLFFEKIGNTPNLDQYVSYYKWIDDALSEMIRELVPASANTSRGLRNVVESHILERNKYRHKFPHLHMRRPEDPAPSGSLINPDPVAPITGRGVFAGNGGAIPWRFSSAPLERAQPNNNKAWWRFRAERDQRHDSSGWHEEIADSTDTNSAREEIRKTVIRTRRLLPGYNSIDRTPAHYRLQTELRQASSLPYNFSGHTLGTVVEDRAHQHSKVRIFKGGSNTPVSNKYDIVNNSLVFGESEASFSGLQFSNIRADSESLRLRDEDFTMEKVRKNYDVELTGSGKGEKYSPFSLFKTSVSTGYNKTLVDNYGISADVTNLHDDTYGPNYETPLQGPYTERHVGGRGYRHNEINRYDDSKQGANNIDGKKDRVEGWKMVNPSDGKLNFVHQDANKPRSSFLRQEYAKRPVSIRNIKTSSSIDDLSNASVQISPVGNYRKDYDILTVTNRSALNRAFIKNRGFEEDSYGSEAISDISEIAKPTYTVTGSAGRTEFAFIQRFSAPGGPETAGDSQGGLGLDYHNSEYSPYNSLNYRNITVRLPLRTFLSGHSAQFGLTGETGITSGDYSGAASYHKQQRNNRYAIAPTSTGFVDRTTNVKVLRDNAFISRPIPQSDLQYSWITASAMTYEGHDVRNTTDLNQIPLGYLHKDGIYSGTTGYSSSLLVVSGSDQGSIVHGSGARRWRANFNLKGGEDHDQFIYTDLLGLNTIIVEEINTASLEMGADNIHGSVFDYLNSSSTPNSADPGDGSGDYAVYPPAQITAVFDGTEGYVLNSILLNRNGAYGYPTWKQIRAGHHPINRLLKKNSKIAVNSTPGKTHVIEEKGKPRRIITNRFASTKVYQEPAITSKYHPVVQIVGVRAEVGDKEAGEEKTVLRPVPFKSTYGNNKTVFANPDLNKSHGFEIKTSQAYDRIKNLYLTDKTDRDASAVDNFIEFRYKETVYPAEQNAYLDKIRRRVSYTNNFWRDQLSAAGTGESGSARIDTPETVHPSLTINREYGAFNITGSRWPLDAAYDFADQVTSSFSGILLNNRCQIHNGSKDQLKAAPYYARLHTLPSTSSVRGVTGPAAETSSFVADPGTDDETVVGEIFGDIGIGHGTALWEAASQAGYVDDNGTFISDPRNPAYDSYDDYVQDLRLKNKDMSIVPEFRISDHIDYYMNTQQGNFLAKNQKLFSIFGVPSGSDTQPPANSSEDEFFKIYSNSDFLKHFDTFKKDHETLVEPSEISLSCKALIKFLPYNGFYPAERTVEMATQFSRSLGPNIRYIGEDSTYTSARFRNVLTPFFAPGIIYNSVKAGIACDYPVYTMGTSAHAKNVVNPDDTAGESSKYYMLGTGSLGLDGYARIPFEDAIKPRVLRRLKILDQEPHPSASIDVTASWDGNTDRLYEMMSNNYHAAVPDFFLQNQNFTTLTSVPESQFESFVSGTFYGMRVRLRKSFHSSSMTDKTVEYPLPHIKLGDNLDNDLYESFTMYSRPSAFGPPVSGRDDIEVAAGVNHANYTQIADSIHGLYPAFTPPYYDGECWFDIVFRATKSKHTLRDVFASSSVFSMRFDPGDYTTGDTAMPYAAENINTFSMQITSSFNIFGLAPIKSVEFDAKGDPRTVKDDFSSDNNAWVMQPKFETPMLNFNTADVTLPNDPSGSASTPRGMWHQFGRLPESPEKGIFFEVSNIEQDWLDHRLPAGDFGATATFPGVGEDVYNFGDLEPLLDKIKFNRKSKRLGEIADSKVVREAVVAVPFVELNGKRRFFEIPREQIDASLGLVDIEKLDDADKPGKSIESMVKKMGNYVFPPTMDFITYPDKIKPFAMYIFEFEHTFDQNDLSYMWQNLMPKSGVQVKEAKASICHKLLINELMGAQAANNGQAIQSNLKWMVFKAKQRAPTNYFDKVVGNSKVADKRFDFAFNIEDRSEIPEFSYNWPYDFFSLVEFAKIEAEIKMSKEESDLSVLDESQILMKGVKSETLTAPEAVVKKVK
jgi:hypothetical protein